MAATGLSIRWWDFLFYAVFGWVVTSFVQIGGVLLVFSYLIVPAVCANFLATRLRWLLLIGWITATVSSMAGLVASYELDLPTGAAIVCALAGGADFDADRVVVAGEAAEGVRREGGVPSCAAGRRFLR